GIAGRRPEKTEQRLGDADVDHPSVDLDPGAQQRPDGSFAGAGLWRQPIREIGLDPAGMNPEGLAGKIGMVEHGPVEWQDGGYAVDGEFCQCAPGACKG